MGPTRILSSTEGEPSLFNGASTTLSSVRTDVDDWIVYHVKPETV